MAPLHTIKKSTTATSESVTRKGHHERRNRIVEEVEEEDEDDEMQDVDDADTDELDSSQQSPVAGPSDHKVAALIGSIVDTRRKRLQVDKASIHKSYAESKKDAQDGITTLFDELEAKSSSAHSAQLTTLRQLLARKAELEATMASKLAQLETEYASHCYDLQRVAELRSKSLQ
ncbi:hypothetical protein K505DRAFT_322420 [Melanomma pulvis-pyrius CBS 109.77]|uniref:Uncharacterized protein n=1 Tax=Melanomma pulvis-pyrius CBS 109.77 TaxID=1314802 RepID=A0A6A6XMC9_9PLEO|nr:hypothetical protein K505DRAFT_322420 [Melanomma pulvis-pyrius CBS 109.77]